MPRTTGTISERPTRTDLPGSRSANEIPEFDVIDIPLPTFEQVGNVRVFYDTPPPRVTTRGRASSIHFTDTFIRNKLSDFRREYNAFPEHIIANHRTLAAINDVFMSNYPEFTSEQTRIYGLVPISNNKYADGKFIVC